MRGCKSLLSVVVSLLVAAVGLASAASAPSTSWEASYGGRHLEMGYSVQQTVDGGYILLGVTLSKGAGQTDFWLIKTNSVGEMEWDQTFGGTMDDWGRGVQQTKDGGYILVGSTFSFGAGKADVWLIKTDANGAKKWARVFGGAEVDLGYAVQQTTDGGYILIGYTQSKGAGRADVWLIKTSSTGSKEWERTFGGSQWDAGYSVQQTRDGGYILVGHTKSKGEGKSDVWLIKTDATGNKLCEKVYGGKEEDVGRWVEQTQDGGYVLVGWTKSKGSGGADIWLVKTNANGVKQWEKTFGGNGNDWSRCVQQTQDGGYILLGSTASFTAEQSYDFWLIKTDANGNRQWDRMYGTPYWDRGRFLQQTRDGGYILIGYKFTVKEQRDHQLWLIKTDSSGN
jgi:hypothetical protein